MFSATFVDRPRLAVVIAVVISIAGALALLRIPVAQFPDIVPPQVQVSTVYPGASAAVVEATVGQPLEAQVNGVDRMLYMRSNSGKDEARNNMRDPTVRHRTEQRTKRSHRSHASDAKAPADHRGGRKHH